MEFWKGFIIGGFIFGCIGLFMAGLCNAAGKEKYERIGTFGDLEQFDGKAIVCSSFLALTIKSLCDCWEFLEDRCASERANKLRHQIDCVTKMAGLK